MTKLKFVKILKNKINKIKRFKFNPLILTIIVKLVIHVKIIISIVHYYYYF